MTERTDAGAWSDTATARIGISAVYDIDVPERINRRRFSFAR
jgi:hypothetical protein